MWIDIGVLLLFVYGLWQGWQQGIISTVFNLLIYIFGIVLAYKMAPFMSTVLENIFNSHHPIMFIAGFGVNFLLIYIIVRIASGSLENVIHGAYLGVFNRAMGGALVGAFYVLLFSILIWFGDQASVLSEESKRVSLSYPVLKEMPGKAKAVVIRFKPLAFSIWDDSMKAMDKMEQIGLEKTEGKSKVYELPVPGKNEPMYETQPQTSKPITRPSGSSRDADSGLEDN
jgi:uncharacterized membrane protein required for colicin V production